ncbi:MAG: apolipoprotein N-acyltransferase [Deltaproteobacteria bacterium]|nr:apolipoprotein N-acyltransferase [Deltaproteobacteria bacterium]
MTLIQYYDKNDRLKIILAVLSGLLLTGSFPKIGISWFAWFALVPLLISLRNLSMQKSFFLGFLTGASHYISLLYWLPYTMKTYGHLPFLLCVIILILLSSFLALYTAGFSAVLSKLCSKPGMSLILAPVIWVSFEYMRTFFFFGFPWELIGYSQYKNLHLIQIADILGVYGVSFLIVLSNSAIYLVFLSITDKRRQKKAVTKRLAAAAISVFAMTFILVWFYGKWSIQSIDKLTYTAPSIKAAIVQGNIDQTIKWDPAFQTKTANKYIKLSLSAKKDNPGLIVWPETATPFYFLNNIMLSNIVQKGIKDTGSDFLIGSPSFVLEKEAVEYYNSAYLITRDGKVCGKYDKAHLVPFGEYVPFNKWLPFIGKFVEGVGDFKSGARGKTITWSDCKLGLQICYEIIFPCLSRDMAINNAAILINITNDAWFGKSAAPYQHFSMAIFRAVENRRSLIRSANTGISGFIDPSGRILGKTDLFVEATMTRCVPVIQITTLYTRFGDLFAIICMVATIICFVLKYNYNIKLRD